MKASTTNQEITLVWSDARQSVDDRGCAVDGPGETQVGSLPQFNSVDFSQSTNGVNK